MYLSPTDPAPKSASRGHAVRRAGLVALAVSAALALAGCGSSSSGNSTTPASSGSSSIDATKTLDSAFKGETFAMPTSSPKTQSGKTVWVLSCVTYQSCQKFDESFVAAGKVLGWNVKVLDNKSDPSTNLSLMKQAISAKVDAIVEFPFDCGLIKSGVELATAAKIPVLSPVGLDCDSDGGQALFAAPVKVNDTDGPESLFAAYGKRDADVLVASAEKAGISSPQIMDFQLTDQPFHALVKKNFDARIKQICSSCKLINADFTVPTLGHGQQFFQNALLAHPTANVAYLPFDEVLPAGLSSALTKATNIKLVVGGNGMSGGIDYLRTARAATVIHEYIYPYFGWATADVLNRLFAGTAKADLPNEGGYDLYVDKDHNLPASGDGVKAPFDYEAAFTKLWTGQ